MSILAATGDTWGISGPTFLGLYAALVVIAATATLLARRSLAAATHQRQQRRWSTPTTSPTCMAGQSWPCSRR
ncbi:MAG: hypothetical protein ACRDRU_00085 [Pseudonocardiaceae bacterium]